ncbi:hypothetical protein CANARDRAFT_26627 [[Candida] arabinofermentans NRRL YB-2248]|uniref:Zn(2)-C6 fungal-type domain-containing protein n=1 Tax=[Candida] arabinofermentans NRRL YB-2248 TaxID=983967 RepID=A0A1E4T612_9ASCO|nr:hypothetical protein CANARDRAFT_26627 [[Candida] arabinofermentans NRRL YB-2248]
MVTEEVASTPEPSTGNKRTRSRKGCHSCKKAKIKCDESKPSCMNCTKNNRECDYSLKLTWGGRPYKKPKVEKLNPVANLSSQQLNSTSMRLINSFGLDSSSATSSSASTPLFAAAQTSFARESIKSSSPVASNLTNRTLSNQRTSLASDPSNKIRVKTENITSLEASCALDTESLQKTANDNTNPTSYANMSIPTYKEASSNDIRSTTAKSIPLKSTTSPVLSLFDMGSPRSMLNFPLAPLRATDSPNMNSNRIDDYESLEESYTPQLISKVRSPVNYISDNNSIPELALNNISNNFQSVSGAIETLITDNILQEKPSAFLEEMDHYSTDFRIAHLNNKNNTRLSETLLNNDQLDADNSSAFIDALVDEYSVDIAKLELLKPQNSSALSSIPYINKKGSRVPRLVIDELEEDSDYEDALALNYYGNSKFDDPYVTRSYSTPSSTNSDTIEQIPRGLQPLPDMLLNVPDYYDSFRFYLDTTSSLLIPIDETMYRNNPFKVVLPQVAITNDGLLSVLVAFGLLHKNQLLNKEEPTEVVDQLLSRSLSELLVLLQNKETATSDLTLSLVLLLSSFMVFTSRSNNWKVHLKGAKQILLMRGYNKPFEKFMKDLKGNHMAISLNNEIKKSRLVYFLIRWFAYLDVLANLSSPLEPTDAEVATFIEQTYKSTPGETATRRSATPEGKPKGTNTKNRIKAIQNGDSKVDPITDFNFDLNENQQIDYEIDTPKTGFQTSSILDDESMDNVDYFMGFDLRFLPLYTQTIKLIRKTNTLLRFTNAGEYKVSPSIIEQAMVIEKEFRRLDSSESLTNISLESNGPSAQDTDNEKYRSLIATNKTFLLMGLIHLYRRVLRIPKSSSLIQEMTKEMRNLVSKYIPNDSANEICLILPIFSAACDCEDEQDREWFCEKLRSFTKKGSPSSAFALEVIQKCWSTGEDWFSILYKENKDIVFL